MSMATATGISDSLPSCAFGAWLSMGVGQPPQTARNRNRPTITGIHSALDFWSIPARGSTKPAVRPFAFRLKGSPMHPPCTSIRAMALAVALAPGSLACAGPFHTVAPAIADPYQRLGEVRSEACGSLVLGVIPAALNSRVARAYAQALGQRAGATALVDVTLTERWFYWVFGTTRCATISGVAVK